MLAVTPPFAVIHAVEGAREIWVFPYSIYAVNPFDV